MDYKNIPQELKNEGLFCVWKQTDRGKTPINPVTSAFAKSNNPNTFNTYQVILQYITQYYVRNVDGKITGGLGLGIFNGFSAIDIDDCIVDGKLSDMATDIVDYVNSYTELSPSGNGIRIIFRTKTRINKDTHYINNRNRGLEIYIDGNTNKFVTLTGRILHQYRDIREVDLGYILERYMIKPSTTQTLEPIKPVGPIDLSDVDSKVKKALEYNVKFREAWTRQASGSGGTESEDDLSLCNFLARIFEGDFIKIDEAFKQSPYYQSKDDLHIKKWARNDYKMQTIKTAVNSYYALKLQDAAEFEYNDTGNAKRFVDNFKNMVHYNVDNKRWMTWNGMYWQHDIMNDVKNRAEIVIEQLRMEALNSSGDLKKVMTSNIKRTLSSFGKEAMIKEAQHMPPMPVTNNDFDKQTHMLNTRSGIVNLRTGDLVPHNKDLKMSKFVDIEVDRENEPTLWLKFLNEIYADNPDLIPYLQVLFGYWLTGETSEQAMYIFLGDGANGKSLLLDIILKVCGEYGTTTQSDLLVDSISGRAGEMTRLAVLQGKRLVMVEETEIGDRLKESSIKNMTSDYGEITARYLYGNEFNYRPIFKLVMATNHRPIIRGTDHGIWRRMKIIPHNIIIPDNKQDKLLGHKLEKELPQILGWAIKGAKIFYENHTIIEPDVIKKQVTEYRSEMDLVQRWILENCEESPNYMETSTNLFKDLTRYIEVNKEYKMSHTTFGRNMAKKFERRRISNRMHYIGIRLREQELADAVMDSKGDFDDV